MFEDRLDEVVQKAHEIGIKLSHERVKEVFGQGTYRWTIQQLGINYGDGMDIGLFDLHQEFDKEDM